ncbi:MAG TPA: murein biosynthesis integral membrane protein MurJ [Plantibacter sp.]|uniref:murein biosynthesis integral membrane protein MurJ n=1 Tax=unclassified Plantibacter TaxID=2624265 RepID=UPI002D08F277|nr:murein biosynthesis integral membrane protein MurJ [Plantibacter sp.]
MADGIGRASALLASGTLVSRLLGFVKAALVANIIGLGIVGNAFGVANQLPNTIYVIIGGGVLSAVLVPQIVKASIHVDGGNAYINKLVTITLVFIGGATVLATLIAPVFVFAAAATLPADQFALATAFAFWCLPQILFYALYTVLGEVLNARKMFGPFTWAPVFNNVVAIAGLALFVFLFGSETPKFSEWTPSMTAVIGGSATLGVVVQAFFLMFFWRRAGLRFRPDFHWRGVGLRATGKIASWTFGMLILTTAAGLIETQAVASASGQGPSVIALQNAWLIFMLPHSIITVSVATAYFTRMSEHGQGTRDRGADLVSLRSDVSAAVRVVSLLIVLASVVIMVVAVPFASVFAKTTDESISLGVVIIAFVLGLVPFCILFILQRAFYALGDTKTPFFYTLFQTLLFILLALIVVMTVPKELLGAGVALAITVAGLAQAVIATWLLRRRLGGLELRKVIPSLLRYAAAALPAAAVGVVVLLLLGGVSEGGFTTSSIPSAIATMAIIGSVMGAVYLVMLALMRTPELKAALAPVLSRFGR